jgi:RNA polymerase sigma-70 factor (family 1)
MKMVVNPTIAPEFINQPDDFIKLMNENDEENKNGKLVFYDAELLIRNAFAENPQKGCELLFRRYHKILCSHAVRFVYSKAIAEDLVSEVFCRFWKNKTHLSVTTSYRMYLFRCVRNEALNHIRSEFKGLEGIDAAYAKEISVGQRPDDITQFEEILQQVENLVESLTPQCRKIFLMNRFEGKKYHEIATELQLSQKTVEAHIGKALSLVRKGLQHHWLASVLIMMMSEMD